MQRRRAVFVMLAVGWAVVLGGLSDRLVCKEHPPQDRGEEVRGVEVEIPDTCSNLPGGTLFRRPNQPKPFAAKKWDENTRILNVVFLDGDDPWGRKVREIVKATVREWEAYANLNFAFDQRSRPHISVKLAPDADYPPGVYQSLLGPDSIDNPPSMCLIFRRGTSERVLRQVIRHEFGHALGMIHEHQRPDITIKWNPANVYRVYRRYFPDVKNRDELIREQIIESYQFRAVARSPFDLCSIMIYPIPPGVADIEVGWAEFLSPMDKSFIARLYPVACNQPNEKYLRVDEPDDGEIAVAGQVARYRLKVSREADYAIEVMEAPGTMPVLMGLFGSTIIESQNGVAAAEGQGARIVATLDPKNVPEGGASPGTYYLEVRHQQPRTGTGRFRVQLRNMSKSSGHTTGS